MKQTITRTISSTKIHHNIIEVDEGNVNAIPVDFITVNGTLDREQANKVLNSHYNGFKEGNVQSAVVTYLDHETSVYEMPLDEFINQAEKIEIKGDN